MATEHVMTEARLQKQKEFIQTKIQKCKQFDKYGLTLIDPNAVIIGSMQGELRNIILSFFKGGLYSEKKCEHCQTTVSHQFERAHNKGTSRPDVALAALKRIRPDETAHVKQKDFIKAFIEEHINIPLWILCKKCHVQYDAKTPKSAV
jgi:5-methylcytosine-specific restriction endonuclease McrA